MKRHETALLWDYAGGALAPADAARVEAHLRECLVCELKLEELKAARSVVAASPVPPLAPERWRDIDRRVAAAARRELGKPRWFSALFGPPGFAFAALAAAAL
ncbi:MAG: zf-HC2 domain-containing protein, partial [Myxococcaceae bacterium]